ncbi:MAG: hypothetical protein A2Z14_00390 [Chloroflexi bacterium RBG_16_48_8]|nr:MAG: hypothetical protein A2Z14_00390 [Chloroflexi bacterium RBG_16_48_8]
MTLFYPSPEILYVYEFKLMVGKVQSVLRERPTGRDPLGSDLIQWATNRHPAALEDMGVDHGGFDVLVTQQLLHGTDIIVIF